MKRKIFISIIVILTISVSAILGISYYAAYKTLHKERQAILKTPTDYGLEFENISFLNKDNNRLKAWWIQGTSKNVVIVAHGYSANRAGWSGTDKEGKKEYLDWLGVAPHLVKAGYSMLYFDMRASGESEGEMISLGKYEADDMLAAIEWALKNKQIENIGLIGFSMGGNVVLRSGIELNEMLKNKIVENAAIIAIGPYKYDTMVKKSIAYWTDLPSFFTPLIKMWAKYLLKFNPSEEINPSNYINQIGNTPILLIQSEKDEIGDVEDVKDIHKTYSGPKDLIIIPDAKRFVHYNYPKDNPEKIIEFYNKHLNK